jgi:hypothetical protein
MKRSETISELAKALVKFNSEVSKIAKDAANPFFKNNYATLDNIIDEVRPVLYKNGLSLMQFPSGDESGLVSVSTFLMHESGEWMESEPLTMKPIKNDPQAIGSCITYARRYSLQAFLNLNTGEDDDGNGASHNNPPKQQPKQQRPPKEQPPKKQQETQKPTGGGNTISDKQLKLLNTLITRMEKEKGFGRDRVLYTFNTKPEIGHFESLKDLTVGQASKAIEMLQKALGDNPNE